MMTELEEAIRSAQDQGMLHSCFECPELADFIGPLLNDKRVRQSILDSLSEDELKFVTERYFKTLEYCPDEDDYNVNHNDSLLECSDPHEFYYTLKPRSPGEIDE